jgi:hypothetical protein
LPPLCRGLSGNEIAESLYGCEIKPAGFERPPRELSRLGKTAAGNRFQRIEHASDDCVTAVQLQLGDVFARFALRARKPQRERFVDYLTVHRIAHANQRGLSRLRDAADQLLKRNARLRPRHAHHRNGRRRPA